MYKRQIINGVVVYNTTYANTITSTDNVLRIGGGYGSTGGLINAKIQDLRIYKGVAKYKGGFDVPKPYTPVGIESWRTVADTCKNNFATWNPLLGPQGCALADGNLTVTSDGANQHKGTRSTMGMSSGKWYWEYRVGTVAVNSYVGVSEYMEPNGLSSTNYIVSGQGGNNYVSPNGSFSVTDSSLTTGMIIGCAFDRDASTQQLKVYKNGSLAVTGTCSDLGDDVLYLAHNSFNAAVSDGWEGNFGQNPTFSDTKANEGKRLNNANNSWTLTHGGSQGNFTVADDGVTLSGTTASSAYMRATYTLDPKKKYIISLKYTAGANNQLAIQDDKGYITTTDGTATTALQVGNHYAAVISASTSVVITATNWNTSYTINNIHLSEYDACYTDDSGKGKFQYQPPAGYLALCEDNLPTPAIADPGDYFKTVLYTGDGNEGHSITGVGFKPDLVWIKCRSHADNHTLTDVVRGSNKAVYSDLTNTEHTSSIRLQSFDTDGFTTGSSGDTNTSGRTFCAWCWKAGGAAVSNTDGGITAQVSANQTAGFSIVSWTGNGSNGATLGHGLGKRPSWVLVKDRDNSRAWYVWVDDLTGSTVNNGMTLNTNSGVAAFGHGHFTSLNNSTMTLTQGGSSLNNHNQNNTDYIAYCWAEIAGFSKFGSYLGNGNADGPFVYCGFKPAWVLIKKTDGSGTENWRLFDSSRCPTNQNNIHLLPSSANAESTETGMDFLSNGFKLRHADAHQNQNGTTYIFAAFAESPFQTANAK